MIEYIKFRPRGDEKIKVRRILCAILCLALLLALVGCAVEDSDAPAITPGTQQTVPTPVVTPVSDTSDFVLVSEVIPDVMLEMRYYSTFNFVGVRIDGYEEPVAILTRQAADALKAAADEFAQLGYRLKIFDAYRPQRAVAHFCAWAQDTADTRMKDYFYPQLDKPELFSLGYIAERSGHSRGSTVDLTLFDMRTAREVDMGGSFDYFGELSHADYTQISSEQYAMRMLLREVMLRHGFRPYSGEWWHFTLENEPFPDTYFDFPVSAASVTDAGYDRAA